MVDTLNPINHHLHNIKKNIYYFYIAHKNNTLKSTNHNLIINKNFQ